MLAHNIRRFAYGIALIAALAGCSRTTVNEDALLMEQQQQQAGSDLGLYAPQSSVLPNATIQLEASGGVSPYNFYIRSGGGSIDPDTGVYTAPQYPGTVTLGVGDSVGATTEITLLIGNWGTSLRISPDTITATVTQQVQFTAGGGSPPYSYSVYMGSGTISSSGAYTAPSFSGSAVIEIVDANGDLAYANVTITEAADLTITPSRVTVISGRTQRFTAAGGVPPYTYAVVSGGGFFDSTNRFNAPWAGGTSMVEVADSRGNSAMATVTIQANYPTSNFNVAFRLRTDHFVAFSFDNNPTYGPPVFGFWDHGPNTGPDDVYRNCRLGIDTCNYGVFPNNFSRDENIGVTYRGTISMSGRGGFADISFCISPDEPTRAYLRWDDGAGITLWRSFNSTGKRIFGGRSTLAAFTAIDTASGTGDADVSFHGAYTGDYDCNDFPAIWVEVSP